MNPARTPRRPARRLPFLPKGSLLARSPFGKLVEALRDIPAEQLTPWPLAPPPPPASPRPPRRS